LLDNASRHVDAHAHTLPVVETFKVPPYEVADVERDPIGNLGCAQRIAKHLERRTDLREFAL
jgi:hypothetical protein